MLKSLGNRTLTTMRLQYDYNTIITQYPKSGFKGRTRNIRKFQNYLQEALTEACRKINKKLLESQGLFPETTLRKDAEFVNREMRETPRFVLYIEGQLTKLPGFKKKNLPKWLAGFLQHTLSFCLTPPLMLHLSETVPRVHIYVIIKAIDLKINLKIAAFLVLRDDHLTTQ